MILVCICKQYIYVNVCACTHAVVLGSILSRTLWPMMKCVHHHLRMAGQKGPYRFFSFGAHSKAHESRWHHVGPHWNHTLSESYYFVAQCLVRMQLIFDVRIDMLKKIILLY